MKKIFNNKKNIAIISILGLILVLGGVYALVNWQSNDYSIAIKSTCMNINYTKGQDISGNLSVIDETSYVSNNTITMNSGMLFSSVRIGIDNVCSDIKGLATIEINIANLSDELKLNGKSYASLKYVVAEYDPTDYTDLDTDVIGDTLTIVSKGNIINTGIIDAHTQYLEPGQVKNYLVIFYVDDKLMDPNMLHSLSFSGTIDSRAEQFVPTPITDFTYTTSGSNVTITRYNGTAQKVNIPSTYAINGTTYNTVVNGSVFYNKTTVREVNFASGVTASNGYAYQMFYGCTNLIKVSGLPSNITNLGYAFYNCTSLVTAPAIPTTVTSMNGTFRGCTKLVNGPVIGNSVSDVQYAFYGCTKLVDAPDIPNAVASTYYTFYNCTSLVTSPYIGNTVTNMNNAFQNCTSLVNVPSIGSGVQNMNHTFSGCSKLETVSTIPDSVTYMQYTFQNCTSLVNVPTLGSSVQNMYYAFYGCTSLVNAPTIPSSVINMSSTFFGCSSLVNVPTIPNSVKYMDSTFYGCTSLVNAPTIPSSVTNMTSTFRGCTSLTGTVRINSSSVTRTSGATYHPFYGTSSSKSITVQVPSGSTTYTNINNNKPSNVTISTFTS